MEGKKVLNAALALLAERAEDTPDYAERGVELINIVLAELYKNEKITAPAPVIKSLDEYIYLNDYLLRTAVPYGLAALLVIEEDPNRAAFFNREYMRLIRRRGKIKRIKDVY